MARLDHFVRQWKLLQLLAEPRWWSIRDLAEQIPRDYACSSRTIRRDLEALDYAGFPLEQETQRAVTVWRLMRDFKHLPPVPLAPSELVAIFLLAHSVPGLKGTPFADAALQIYRKIVPALPPRMAEFLKVISARYSWLPGFEWRGDGEQYVRDLMRTVNECETVALRYHSLTTGSVRSRDVDPYHLFFWNNSLYLVGYCHWRRDLRTFAVPRIRELNRTGKRFQPADFRVEDYLKSSLGVWRGSAEPVLLKFEKGIASWVQEKRWHASQRLRHLPGGRLEMHLEVALTPELKRWVLSFGSDVEVLGPESLRRQISQEAGAVGTKYLRRPQAVSPFVTRSRYKKSL